MGISYSFQYILSKAFDVTCAWYAIFFDDCDEILFKGFYEKRQGRT